MDETQSLRDHLVYLLKGGGAHIDVESVFRGVPQEMRGGRPEGFSYSLWELLEHLRIAQWDILEFSRDPEHVSPEWPDGYWPPGSEPPSDDAWDEAVAALSGDLAQMVGLVEDPEADLFTPFSWGSGQTLLREALLVADHNAYHAGQTVVLRKALGSWPPEPA